MTVNGFLVTELVHHDLGNLITGTTPDINNLVVALTIGHQTVGVLNFDFFNFSFRRSNDLVFLGRDAHVVGTEGNTRASCQGITILH